jgi:hypothetical protein
MAVLNLAVLNQGVAGLNLSVGLHCPSRDCINDQIWGSNWGDFKRQEKISMSLYKLK